MATEERKAQLEFEVGDNTKPGIDSIKAGVAGIGDAAAAAAGQASTALDGIADKGEQVAERMERKNTALRNSIKRTLSETQRELAQMQNAASGGGQTDVFDNLIRMRGGDAQALKPYLDSLRAARSEVDNLRLAEQKRAVDLNFEKERAAAEQARRRADAIAGLTVALERQEAVERQAASQNAFVQSLKAQSDAIGKTRADLLELQAAQMGVSSQAAPYIARLREQEVALKKSGAAMNQYGMTTKATAAAMRGVPAQITDIFVSLQGGQAPLTVLLQQGGQLKDMFGGIVPAARALGAGLLAVVGPTTLLLGGVAALTLAYYQGSQEADAYNKALVLTGNRAGTTSAQMKQAAKDVSEVVGTQGAAAEVLAMLASTGEVGATNMAKFAEVTLKTERDLGIAAKDMVKNFADLGESPVEASLRLTKQYGFLTAATYEQIRALRDQGREQEAATLAQTTFANAMDTKSAQLRTQLGAIEKAWYGIKTGAKGAWDAMLNVGRAETSADMLRDLQAELQKKETTPLAVDSEAMRVSRQKGIDNLKERIGLLQSDERMQRRGAEAAAQRQQAEEAGIRFSKAVYDTKTKEQKLEIEIDKLRRDGVAAGKEEWEIEKAIAQVRSNNAKSTKGDDRSAQARQAELADLQAKIKAETDYTARLKEQGIQAEKNNAGLKLTDEIEGQLKGKLDSKTRSHLEQKLALAQQLDVASQLRQVEEDRAKAVAKAEETMRKQTQAVYDEASATEQQRQRLDETTEAYGKSAVAVAKLTAERIKLRLAEADSSDSFDPSYVANLRRLLKEQEALVGSLQVAEYEKINRALDEQITKGTDQNALLTEEIGLIGMTEVERKKIIAVREVELKLAKELRDIDQLSVEPEQKESLRAKARERSRIEANNAANKVILDDWTKTADQINSSLTDALLRGFESGKDFASNLRDTVVNMFKTMVLRPVISAVLAPISGGISGLLGGGAGAPGGGVGGILNMASNASSLYNGYGAFSQFLGGGTAGASSLSMAYANTVGAFGGDSLGALIQANGGWSGVSTPAVAGQVGGGGALAGAGAFAAVAALALNVLGAFKSERKNGGGLRGTLGGGTLSAWEEWREGGTLFNGPSFSTFEPVQELEMQRAKLASLRDSGQGGSQQAATLQTIIDNLEEQYGDLATATAAQSKIIQTAYDAMRDSAGDMADALGLSSTKVREFTTLLGGEKGLAIDGLKPEEQQAKIAEALATANNELAQQLIGTWETTVSDVTRIVSENLGSAGEDASIVYSELTDTVSKTKYVASEYAREGEKAIDTLTRLASSITVVSDTADALGYGLGEASLAAANAASNIVDAFGGLEGFTRTLGTYFDNFYSDAEKKSATARQVSRALSDVGFEIDPAELENLTRPAIRAFVESVGKEFGFDSEKYGVAVNQAIVLAGITETVQAVDKAANSASDAADEARKKWQAITDELLGDQAQLGIDLLRAQGREEEALAAERAKAIVGYDAYQVALYDSNTVLRTQIAELEKLNEYRDEEKQLVIDLLTARGDEAGALNLITAGMSAAERAAYLYNRTLQKQVETVQALANELPGVIDKFLTPDQRASNQYAGITVDLLKAGLSGLEVNELTEALLGASKNEIAQAAIEVYNMAGLTDEMRLALVRAAGGLADLKDAADATKFDAADEAYAALERAVKAQRDIVQETIDAVKDVFEAVRDASRGLFGEVKDAATKQARDARGFITQALSAAQTTGYLPEGDAIKEAIDSARAGLDQQVFKSQADADFERLVLANELRGLELISGDQLSEAEKQAENLDKILTTAKSQLDELKGINTGVLSVAEALANFNLEIRKAGGGGAGGTTAGTTVTTPQGDVFNGRNGAQYDSRTGTGYMAGSGTPWIVESVRAEAQALLASGQDAAVVAAIKSQGYTHEQAEKMLGIDLPQFRLGTNYVTADGLAYLHAGEAVVPKAYNPAAGSKTSASTARLEAIMAGMVKEISRLNATVLAGNIEQRRTANAVNGNPDMPMVVKAV